MLSPAYAAVSPEIRPGRCCGPDGDTKGYPVEILAGEVACDEEAAKRLWDVSEELTGIRYGF